MKRPLTSLLHAAAACLALAAQARAQTPQRIASANLCADQLLMALAEPAQIASLSPIARDARLSFHAERAARFPANRGHGEDLVRLDADLAIVQHLRGRAAVDRVFYTASELGDWSLLWHLLGAGQGHTHEHLVCAPSLTEFGCKQAAARAFAQAGVSVADIDVAEVYDSFTITLLVELESMGFFPRGHAGPAAAEGALGLAGSLPCNTHGGLLSFGHSGAAGGMFHVVEGVRQLRGECGPRQVQIGRAHV